MSLTKVSYSMIKGAPVNVVDYGADPTGTTDSSAAFQAAITAAAGKELVAVGTFLIATQLNLESNSVYSFYGATLTPSGASISIMFNAVAKTDIQVYGGKFICVPGVSPIINTHPTGTYYSGAPFYFQDCTNIVVKDTYTYRYFTVIDLYNCSDVLIQSNVTSDCAGGIQAVARSNVSANYVCNGLTFADNVLLHAGDDALTLLTISGTNGEFHTCKIVNNYVSKNPGVNGTVGLSKAIALYGDYTLNPITNTVIANNTAYFVGESMIQATGLFSCTVANNSVDYFGMAGVNKAFWVNGCLDTIFANNTADNGFFISGGLGSVIFDIQDSNRCRFVHNHGVCTSNGQGAVLVRDNSDSNLFDGNVFHNSVAYGILIEASSNFNQILNNDLSIFTALAIADSGTNTFISNNRGFATSSEGTATIISGASTVLVSNNLSLPQSTSRIFITIMPTSSWGGTSSFWVDTITLSQFNIRVNIATSADVTFQWQAVVI